MRWVSVCGRLPVSISQASDCCRTAEFVSKPCSLIHAFIFAPVFLPDRPLQSSSLGTDFFYQNSGERIVSQGSIAIYVLNCNAEVCNWKSLLVCLALEANGSSPRADQPSLPSSAKGESASDSSLGGSLVSDQDQELPTRLGDSSMGVVETLLESCGIILSGKCCS